MRNPYACNKTPLCPALPNRSDCSNQARGAAVRSPWQLCVNLLAGHADLQKRREPVLCASAPGHLRFASEEDGAMRAEQGWWRARKGILWFILGGLGLCPLSRAGAQGPALNCPAPLNLTACRQLALEHNPTVAAARATLAAAQARVAAAENLHTVPLVTPDLPIRRKQAAIGVSIAEAGVRRAEADVIYGVTYCYLAYLYATEQLQVAQKAADSLQELRTGVRRGVQAGRTNVSQVDLPRIDAYMGLARTRKKEAEFGRQRALAGLREALGMAPGCPLVLADQEMPRISPVVDRCQVHDLALANRPELAQATGLAEVTSYEVDAQSRRLLPNSRTFAANSDLHAQAVPGGTAGSLEDSYRPSALAPEMPPFLSGKRCDRIEQAEAYSARAAAVADKTRDLIGLDVEQAFLRWQEAAAQLPELDQAAGDARKAFDALKERFNAETRGATVSEWLSYGTLRTDLLVEANRVRFRLLVSLAHLERATGGAFCPGLAPPAVILGAPSTNEAKPD